MAKVKGFFLSRSNVKVYIVGHKVKSNHWKVLSQGMYVWNMKALPLLFNRSNFKDKVTRSNILEPMERYLNKECTYKYVI